MNPGNCYLYEYDNIRKIRNVGFFKITRHYHTCILQIQARGIGVRPQEKADLYVFFQDGERTIAKCLGSLPCMAQSLSARISVSESEFPENRTLERIDGFFLKPASPGSLLFWVASHMVPKNITMYEDLQAPEEAPVTPEAAPATPPEETPVTPPEEALMAPPEGTPVTPPETVLEGSLPPEETSEDDMPQVAVPSENAMSEEAQSMQDEIIPETETTAAESIAKPEAFTEDISPESETAEDVELEPESFSEDITSEQETFSEETVRQTTSGDMADMEQSAGTCESDDSTGFCDTAAGTRQSDDSAGSCDTAADTDSERPNRSAKKIQRSDLTLLPRKFWFLANNSFLLHGYHNYNHLLLVEEDGHYWLGVPGIYDSHEARAAGLFGFPQFTRSYVEILDLGEDERNDDADFGHWCRYIK